MPKKSGSSSKPAPALESHKNAEVTVARFPAAVMALAEKIGKTPLAFWYENDGRTLAIQWTDYSKDRFDVE